MFQKHRTLTPALLEHILEFPTQYSRENTESAVLLQMLLPELKKQKKQLSVGNCLAQALLALPILFLMGLCIFWIVSAIQLSLPKMFVWASILLAAIVINTAQQLPIPILYLPTRFTQILTLASYQMEREKDPRCLSALLDILILGGEPLLITDAGKALSKLRSKTIQLLPYLSTENAFALTDAQRVYIRRQWLQPGSVPTGQIAALLVMASAKDTESLPLAQVLLTSTTNDSVKEAARELLNAMGS